jgi:hypothetical protein
MLPECKQKLTPKSRLIVRDMIKCGTSSRPPLLLLLQGK